MMDTGFGFLQPVWLSFIPLIWLLWFVYKDADISWPKWLPTLSIRYPELNNIKSSTSFTIKPEAKSFNPQNIKLVIILSLFFFSLSQPVQYLGLINKQKQEQTLDMILAIDTALSMSLKDYLINNLPVSRLDLVKQSISGFLPEFKGSRMALVVLGNPPSVLLPLTMDKAVTQFELMRLTTFLGGRITDTGATLQLINEQFSIPGEKIVVIISDGGTQVGAVSPEAAAERLIKKGFIVHVIAVGASHLEGGQLDNSSLLYEPVNLTGLEKLAQKGGGQLFHVQDIRHFIHVLNDIQMKHFQLKNDVEDQQPLSRDKQLTRPLFIWPLISAMILLLWLALHPYSKEL